MWRVPRVQNMSSFWPSNTPEFRFLDTKLTIDLYSFDLQLRPPTLSTQFIVGKIPGGGGSN